MHDSEHVDAMLFYTCDGVAALPSTKHLENHDENGSLHEFVVCKIRTPE